MNLGKAYNQGTLCYGFRGPRSCFLAPPTVGSRGADPVTSDLWFVCPSVCLVCEQFGKSGSPPTVLKLSLRNAGNS